MNREKLNQTANRLSSLLASAIEIYDSRDALFAHIKNDEQKSISEKIDIMERAIQLIRINNRCLENKLDFDEFVQGSISIESEKLIYSPPPKFKRNRPGTPPIYLQPKLLIYLLYRNSSGKQKIYDIIENFIKLIWNQLKILDFENTKTGVMRCFTNTRFAANTLRDYGMLEFTKKEAFKTWTLSFTGTMVALKFLRDNEWEKPVYVEKYSTDLHPNIKSAFKRLREYNDFVDTLTISSKADAKISVDHQEGLKSTHELLKKYHSILKNPDLKKSEMKEQCSNIIVELKNNESIKALFHKLESNFQIGEIKQIS